MKRTEDTAGISGAERKRVEAVVETLATIGCQGESVAEVAHDARNMVTALGLYCDLIEEPGVLSTPFTHYGSELRLVAAASRRLVEKLVALDEGCEAMLPMDVGSRRGRTFRTSADTSLGTSLGTNAGTDTSAYRNAHSEALQAAGAGSRSAISAAAGRTSPLVADARQPGRAWLENRRRETPGRWDLMPAAPIENMAAELLANHNLLAALAGPMIVLTVDVEGAARGVRLTGEDLTRVLVNLVKNAAEAMPGGGRIQIELHEMAEAVGTMDALVLTLEDNGPGIRNAALVEIFTSGYTTRTKGADSKGSWPVIHRGLGLSITRSIVEAAGGRIAAANRSEGGARFEIELPVRKS